MIIAINKADLIPLPFSNLKTACEELGLKYNTLVRKKQYPIESNEYTLHKCELIKARMHNAGGNLPN